MKRIGETGLNHITESVRNKRDKIVERNDKKSNIVTEDKRSDMR